jgi:hypothetical protein
MVDRMVCSLPDSLFEWARSAPELTCYHTVSELEADLDGWALQGAALTTVGFSSEGRPIRMASIGSGRRSLLAWGYPHPDEPLGAEALRYLGNSLLDGTMSLPGWTVHVILCADPDNARRQLWAGRTLPLSAEEFVRGAWRPLRLGMEVDYGFPLDWGPFYHPPDYEGECRLPSECALRCGPDSCRRRGRPFGPLPESLALATAIDIAAPDVVGLMHCTHTGGDYTFLSSAVSDGFLDEMQQIPGRFGLTRHLGIPIDRGRPFRRGQPDVIAERDLHWMERKLRRDPRFSDEFVYAGCKSAMCYVQAQNPNVQVVTPESTQFRHPWFGDRGPCDFRETVQVSVEDRPRSGRCEVTRILADGRWVIAQQQRTDRPLSAPTERTVPLTAAMAGVRAVFQRAAAMRAMDAVWDQLNVSSLVYHPYVDERARTSNSVEGEGWLRYLRTDPRFHRPASRAEYASFAWLWPIHTASLMGNFQNFLAAQPSHLPGVADAKAALDALQGRQLAAVPAGVRVEGSTRAAIGSILGRLLLCLQETAGSAEEPAAVNHSPSMWN